ncbi:MAG: 1-phosphofructokinase family hexose kinase [Clostridia bacterium]|nr:1-phosphofructokinase family hexose kinase [Clostridia bacterium]
MVLCICLNPAIDKYVKENNTPITISYGGKAINTAVTLSVLGVPSTVLGFVGEQEYSQYDDMLSSRGITNRLIPSSPHTRTNLKIICDNGDITEKNERGFSPDKNSQLLLLDEVSRLTKTHDIALISGSLPPEIDSSYLLKIISRLTIPFVLDTYPTDIHDILKQKPILIKPNRYELAKILGETYDNEEEISSHAKKLLNYGVQNILISLDKTGAILINNQTCIYAKSPLLDTISTVGAGDSMIAGYIYSYLNGFDHTSTLINAVSAGSSHTLTEGTLPMQKSDYIRLKQEISVTSI